MNFGQVVLRIPFEDHAGALEVDFTSRNLDIVPNVLSSTWNPEVAIAVRASRSFVITAPHSSIMLKDTVSSNRRVKLKLISYGVERERWGVSMEPDDELCLCFHVSKRKVVNYLRVEKPQRVGQLAECFGAGTGCGWCRLFLEQLFDESCDDGRLTRDMPTADQYTQMRAKYLDKGNSRQV